MYRPGVQEEIDPDLVIPDRRKSIAQGAIEGWFKGELFLPVLEGLAGHYGFSVDTPWKGWTRNTWM
jgi:excinuclease ABC subunit A